MVDSYAVLSAGNNQKAYKDIKKLGLYLLFKLYHEDNDVMPIENPREFKDFWQAKINFPTADEFRDDIGSYIKTFHRALWFRVKEHTLPLAHFILMNWEGFSSLPE